MHASSRDSRDRTDSPATSAAPTRHQRTWHRFLHRLLALAILVLTGAQAVSARDSSCELQIGDQTLTYPHVHAIAKPNAFDEAKQDVEIYCFREPVPSEKQSPSGLVWVEPSNRIQITLSPDNRVTAVHVSTPEIMTSVSGIGFGVDFHGERQGGDVKGNIATSRDLEGLFNGEKTKPWRVTATLDTPLLGN